jgi:hypothetical protein
MILGTIATLDRENEQKSQQACTDNHVQRVHSCHREIDPVKQLNLFYSRVPEKMQLVWVRVTFLRDFRTK